jgi:predicted TIM-barrel fold metal-dependent hydrolase
MQENDLRLMANLSGGSSPRTFAQMQAMSQQMDGRIVHFFNPNFRTVGQAGWAYEQAEMLKTSVERFDYRGLKIAKVLGLGARDENGLLIEVDDPLLQPLWEMAAFLNIPVAIHTGDPRAFWEATSPANERYTELALHPNWSYFDRTQSGEVPSWTDLLAGFEEVVRANPGTPFIGVHFGNAGEDLDFVERMLATYPNFYVDIAARLGEIGRHDPARVRALFLRFQDRVLFGTDIGITPYGLMLGAPGEEPSRPEDIKPFYDIHWRFLETSDNPMPHPTPIQGEWSIAGISLPEPVLEKVYVLNAVSLLGLDQPPKKWEAEANNQP